MTELFVYGTLRRGAVYNAMMDGARFVEAAQTAPTYTLISLGWFPGMLDAGSTTIVGEVYEVGDALLADLGEYEGPWFSLGAATLQNGRQVSAYFVDPAAAAGRPTIASGDFLAPA